eukprot:gene9689-biopygen1600
MWRRWGSCHSPCNTACVCMGQVGSRGLKVEEEPPIRRYQKGEVEEAPQSRDIFLFFYNPVRIVESGEVREESPFRRLCIVVSGEVEEEPPIRRVCIV